MTRSHFEPGSARRIRMVVLHATAGRNPGDLRWLRGGGSEQRPVSVHYYIDKAGRIAQLVADEDIAWHAGASNWTVDGRRVRGCNAVSLGIELENLNTGSDPYPPAQLDAAIQLTRRLVSQYGVPRAQLVRHLDIAPGRKTDPAGFPWASFVEAVFADAPREPGEELRARLLEAAYRAAGGDAPAEWPLLRGALSRRTGMPVMAITPQRLGGTPPPAAAQDDLARPVLIAGRQLVLEAYGRDLLYAPFDHLEAVAYLSDTAPGALRDELLQALFRAASPAQGYRPDWAFHQFYLKHMPALGVPIGPSLRLPPTPSGRAYLCQHFALDSLCAPLGEERRIVRLSELPDDHELRALALGDLYRARTGRRFEPGAILCRYALEHELGAPLADARVEQVAGDHWLLMPFALDVLFCRASPDGRWNAAPVGALAGTLGAPAEAGIGRLSTLGAAELPPAGRRPLQLLGAPDPAPTLLNLTPHADEHRRPTGALPALLVVRPAEGQGALRLAAESPLWHYYVDGRGAILQLLDECYALPMPETAPTAHGAQRALIVAVENGAHAPSAHQARALGWLVARLARQYQLESHQIVATRDWFARRAATQQENSHARARS
jgi:hypothetical protein